MKTAMIKPSKLLPIIASRHFQVVLVLSLLVAVSGIWFISPPKSLPISPDTPPAIADQIRDLRSLNPFKSGDAASNLGFIGGVPAVPHLVRALEDNRIYNIFSGSRVADQARCALGNIGGDAVVDAVATLLQKTKNKRTRLQAIHTLDQDRVRDYGCKPWITRLLAEIYAEKKSDMRTKCVIINILASSGDKNAYEILQRASKDADQIVSNYAVLALRRLSVTNALDLILAQLQSSSAQTRTRAAEDLFLVKDIRALEALVAATADTEESVRSAACWTLAREAPIWTFGTGMESNWTHGDWDSWLVEWKANLSFRFTEIPKRTPVQVDNDLDRTLTLVMVATNTRVAFGTRIDAIHLLQRSKDVRSVEALISLLEDQEYFIREDAESALRMITGQKDGFRDRAAWQHWYEDNREYINKQFEWAKRTQAVGTVDQSAKVRPETTK